TGDGAGILIQVPDAFLRARCEELKIALPPAGEYGVGTLFMDPNPADQKTAQAHFERIVAEEGQVFLGWRPMTTDNAALGASARSLEPKMAQALIGWGKSIKDPDQFERKLFVIR